MEKFELLIRPSLFHNVKRVTITKEFIEYSEKKGTNSTPIKLLKEEIEGIRYGVKWIRGLEFYIGRIYCIDIKKKDNSVFKIRLKSVYKIRAKILREKYIQLLNTLFQSFFYELVIYYLNQFRNNESFQLCGLTFMKEGILLDNKTGLIKWDDIETKSFQTYYAIFSKTDSKKYRAFEYLNEWNTCVLYSVSDQILADKKNLTENKMEL